MSSAVSRRLSARLTRENLPTTPRIYYYRNRVMNPRRATESPGTTHNLDYSESETEPAYPDQTAATATTNGKRGSRKVKSPVKTEPLEAEEQDSEEHEQTQHSELPSGVKEAEEEGDNDESRFGAEPPSPISRVVLDTDFDETSEPKGSSPLVYNGSATSLSRARRSGSAETFGAEPEEQRSQFLVEDDDEEEGEAVSEFLSPLDAAVKRVSNATDDNDELPFLNQAVLAFSVGVSFLTAVDVWLFANIRKQPFSALTTCLLILGLLLFLTTPPTPSSNISSQIEYALRHAEASANKSLAQQQESLLAQLNPVVLQALDRIRQQDERLDKLSALSGELSTLTQGVQELRDSVQGQQYHTNYRLNTAEQSLAGLRKEWKSDIEPLQSLFVETRAQMASEIHQLRDRVDEVGRTVSDREKQLEGLSASKTLILEWVDSKLAEFAQQQGTQLSQYLGDRQLSAAQLLQIKEYLQSADAQPSTDASPSLGMSAARVEEIARRVAIDIGGRPDFALHSAGAEVVGYLTSPTYGDRVSSFGTFGKLVEALSGGPVARKAHPGQALTLDLTPGSCWPMAGSQGNLTVQLARAITPTDVTIMHVPKELAHDPSRLSAPADFVVWSLRSDPQTNELLRTRLGQGRYQLDQPTAQTFQLTSVDGTAQHIMFEFLSNHGHPDFTCLYRVSVHGH